MLSKEFIYDYITGLNRPHLCKQKIVVFESDDWGMTRTMSKKSLERLKKFFPSNYINVYEEFDSLERNKDVSGLLEVLIKHKTPQGIRPNFTLNNIVANPNFTEIINSNFRNYHYEPFTETLSNYNDSSAVIQTCKEGVAEGVLSIEFHGREHLNINRWMNSLVEGNSLLRKAVSEGHIAHSDNYPPSGRRDYLDAFGFAYKSQFETEESIISSGLDIFKRVWGFQPTSFIAPCYTWHSNIEPYLFKNGVKFIQGNRVQRVPHKNETLEVKRTYNWHGKKHRSGLLSVTRSFDFEPVTAKNKLEYLDKKMFELNNYLSNRMPVVISSHRVNYIGRISERNRDENLNLLDKFLAFIVETHPDVVFLSSAELATRYLNKNHE